MMNDYFYDLVSDLNDVLGHPYLFTATFSGENSNFVRFNRAKVRQAGSVDQYTVQVDVIKGQRHVLVSLSLGGNLEDDKRALKSLVETAKPQLEFFEDDPFLLYATNVHNSEEVVRATLPQAREITHAILDAASGTEFVGIHAQGLTHRGFANSLGQRNFVTRETFNTDFSIYLSADKAVKSNVAGKEWSTHRFVADVEKCKKMLSVLARPAKTIPKGSYRAFLSPSAVHEIFSLLSWGAFSEKQGRTKQSPLMSLRDGERTLHPSVHIVENTSGGISAPFQSGGFLKPARVDLIKEGAWVNGLVSPRTAREYGALANGANNAESPESLEMGAGHLENANVLSSLHTGVLINNLWYLNFSDRTKCQMTGMTRFATFWVENGEIVAPINVMRFDDSIYRLFGSQLEALTKDRSYILDQSTYEERSTHSAHLPGALVNEIAFTL
jgi:predicted Zn-dependent protease